MPRVSVTRTYLDLGPGIAYQATEPPPGSHWRELSRDDWEATRQLYVEVGGDYHWHDRLVWPETQWAAHVAGEGTRVFVLEVDGLAGGYVELARVGDAVEIAYFGLMAFAQGRGLGRWMLERAIAEAQAWGAARVWLHTCTLDSPAALPNYRSRGFEIVRTESFSEDLPDA
jgi:GNAT superfamily N-acetyltransferase